MAKIRPAAVAGRFYPADARELAGTVGRFLDEGKARLPSTMPPVAAVIAPHAGYVYSGQVAGTAFAALQGGPPVERAVILGPSHHADFRGIAVPEAGFFDTPLGEVEVDREAMSILSGLPWVIASDRIHAPEHALEVELPFLLALAAPGLRIVPMLTGGVSAVEVADSLEPFLGEPGTVVVVSSDLSHYLPYAAARQTDAETGAFITRLDGERVTPQRACGFRAVRGLLEIVRRRDGRVESLDLRNSGDTAGPRDQVVGYGAFAARF